MKNRVIENIDKDSFTKLQIEVKNLLIVNLLKNNNDWSIFKGRAGQILVLFEWAELTNDSSLNHYAFELLQNDLIQLNILINSGADHSWGQNFFSIGWLLIECLNRSYIDEESDLSCIDILNNYLTLHFEHIKENGKYIDHLTLLMYLLSSQFLSKKRACLNYKKNTAIVIVLLNMLELNITKAPKFCAITFYALVLKYYHLIEHNTGLHEERKKRIAKFLSLRFAACPLISVLSDTFFIDEVDRLTSQPSFAVQADQLIYLAVIRITFLSRSSFISTECYHWARKDPERWYYYYSRYKRSENYGLYQGLAGLLTFSI